MQAPIWHSFATPSELDNALAEFVATRLHEAIAERGTASIALSGGRTPASFLRALSQLSLDWENIHLTLADERWVNADHPDSNARLLHETLLTEAAASHFVPLFNGATSAVAGQLDCETQLASLPWPLDVVVLGMGDDGHTASLFPQAPQLEHACTTSEHCAAIDPITAPHPRITLTLTALVSARNLVIHITGERKRHLLESALVQVTAETNPPLPIRRVLQSCPAIPRVFWAP